MNRRDMIRLALILSTAGCTKSFSGKVLDQALPTGKPSRDVFPGDTRQMVASICELIIPKTDTPGAIEAGVPQFIELMVADWYTDTERRIFLGGLEALDADCKKNFGRGFTGCSEAQQTTALQGAERQALQYAESYTPKISTTTGEEIADETAPLFSKIKELTVLGYYTSQVGATQELSYHPVPGRYEANFPFSKFGKQWSF